MSIKSLLNSLPRGEPRFIQPMKAKLAAKLRSGKEWAYEIKFDGVRAIAIKDRFKVQLISRNGKNLALKYPGVAAAIRNLKCDQLVIDGEVVALDEKGRSSFQLLQRAGQLFRGAPDLFFYSFDLLHLNHHDTLGLPLSRRKALLRTLLAGNSECIRFSDFIPGSPDEVSSALQSLGLEGIIAKQRESKYEAGLRSNCWVKFKWAAEQEFVIGGYTDPEGSRKFFGAILVGYYSAGKLLFASKVGTGFDDKGLASLSGQFQKLRRSKCPFANLPEKRPGSSRGGLTLPQFKACHWIDPALVCQVRFTEWTNDGRLRHPVFLGLREDKNPLKVVREQPE